jgi:hypothetical protein
MDPYLDVVRLGLLTLKDEEFDRVFCNFGLPDEEDSISLYLSFFLFFLLFLFWWKKGKREEKRSTKK